jgi:hypothetical protein
LAEIILRLMSDQNIRVDSDHRRPHRLRIARFIAARLTGLAGRLSIPASSDASTLTGNTLTTQVFRLKVVAQYQRSAALIDHTFQAIPGWRLSRFRTSFGMVVWPLLVNVCTSHPC